jgi:shikimate dehydrogenase
MGINAQVEPADAGPNAWIWFKRIHIPVGSGVATQTLPVFCWPMKVLTGNARVAGIIGWPVTHSRSPRLHGFWLNRYDIDGTYVPLPVAPGAIEAAVRGIAAIGVVGANVTIPHKQAAFDVCDVVDDFAKRAGTVNTLVIRNGLVEGSNSDGYGFIENLRSHGIDPGLGSALIVGAGGAAHAIAAALQDNGTHVTIVNRSPERARSLKDQLPGLRTLEWNVRNEALADHALVVNTTSLGMEGHPPLELNLDRARETLVVADIVYVPEETPLLAAARRRGLRCVGGLGMLLHQARRGFAAWFGIDPVVDDELADFVRVDLHR